MCRMPNIAAGGSVLTAGWIYPDTERAGSYIFTNVTGHCNVDVQRLSELREAIKRSGLTSFQYKFVEHIPGPVGRRNLAEMNVDASQMG